MANSPVDPFVRMRDEFPYFLHVLFTRLGIGTPSRVHIDIANHLQHGPKKRIIMGFRGLSKTYITVAFILWHLFRDGDKRIMFVGANETNAKSSLHLAKQWLNNDKLPHLKHMRPRRGDLSGALKFNVGTSSGTHKDPSLAAVGITGAMTGRRADIIVADDIENRENAQTVEMRGKISHASNEFESILVPGGELIFIGTPQHEETLLASKAEAGYPAIGWPCRYPTSDDWGDPKDPLSLHNILSPTLRKDMESGKADPGDPVWPEVFGAEVLREREMKVGRSEFAMQFLLQRDTRKTRYPLRLSDLIVMDTNRSKAPISIGWGKRNNSGSTVIEDIPMVGFTGDAFHAPIMIDKDWESYHGCKMAVDPSGAGKDKTAYCIIGQLNGYLYVHEVRGLEGGYSEEVLATIADAARNWRVNEIVVENEFGGGSVAQLLRAPLDRVKIEPGSKLEPDGWNCSAIGQSFGRKQKEVRIISTLEPVMNQHRLVWNRQVAENTTLQHQLTRITGTRNCLKHDDELDALAMCVSLWQSELAQNPEQQAASQREEAYFARIREFQERSQGIHAQRPRWHHV